MTVFWKPLRDDDSRLTPGLQIKQLGSRTFALWARCQACQGSGPLADFTLWERGNDVGTLCTSCCEREEIRLMLIEDDWFRVA